MCSDELNYFTSIWPLETFSNVYQNFILEHMWKWHIPIVTNLWGGWESEHHRGPRHRNSFPAPSQWRLHICQARAKWRCGLPHSKNRKKFFSFLGQVLSWPNMMFSTVYNATLPLAWRYSSKNQALGSAPDPCPATHCLRCKVLLTSRAPLEWEAQRSLSWDQHRAGQ